MNVLPKKLELGMLSIITVFGERRTSSFPSARGALRRMSDVMRELLPRDQTQLRLSTDRIQDVLPAGSGRSAQRAKRDHRYLTVNC